MALGRQHLDGCGRELTERIDTAMWHLSEAITSRVTKVHLRMLACDTIVCTALPALDLPSLKLQALRLS
jgi:hypothetical protein